MNHLIISLCAGVLGITLGIGTYHAATIDQQSVGDRYTSAPIIIQAAPGYMQPGNNELYADDAPSSIAQPVQNSHQGINELKKRLDQLTRQQTSIKGEQTELNREINAIQFRLDSHSASFRPLQSENGESTESAIPTAEPDTMNPLILPPR